MTDPAAAPAQRVGDAVDLLRATIDQNVYMYYGDGHEVVAAAVDAVADVLADAAIAVEVWESMMPERQAAMLLSARIRHEFPKAKITYTRDDVLMRVEVNDVMVASFHRYTGRGRRGVTVYSLWPGGTKYGTPVGIVGAVMDELRDRLPRLVG